MLNYLCGSDEANEWLSHLSGLVHWHPTDWQLNYILILFYWLNHVVEWSAWEMRWPTSYSADPNRGQWSTWKRRWKWVVSEITDGRWALVTYDMYNICGSCLATWVLLRRFTLSQMDPQNELHLAEGHLKWRPFGGSVLKGFACIDWWLPVLAVTGTMKQETFSFGWLWVHYVEIMEATEDWSFHLAGKHGQGWGNALGWLKIE